MMNVFCPPGTLCFHSDPQWEGLKGWAALCAPSSGGCHEIKIQFNYWWSQRVEGWGKRDVTLIELFLCYSCDRVFPVWVWFHLLFQHVATMSIKWLIADAALFAGMPESCSVVWTLFCCEGSCNKNEPSSHSNQPIKSLLDLEFQLNLTMVQWWMMLVIKHVDMMCTVWCSVSLCMCSACSAGLSCPSAGSMLLCSWWVHKNTPYLPPGYWTGNQSSLVVWWLVV